MRVLGIVAEYNPFHNGHLYHLKKSIEITGATHTIAVMSGNFVQRGEPAIFNKWARAEMAIKSGVDLVIELPAVYALKSAEGFAMGALGVLDGLGVVDSLCFGSESGNLQKLEYISRILSDEPKGYKALLRYYLSRGHSYPSARASALKEYLGPSAEALIPPLNLSNNILAIEYLKAIKELESNISPYTIKRHAAGYHSRALPSNIASATAIRNGIIKGNAFMKKVEKTLPAASLHILNRELSLGRGPVYHNLFSLPSVMLVRRLGTKALTQFPEVIEGLENRIMAAAARETTLSDMLDQIKTKRYTHTRLRRIMTYIFLDITKDLLKELSQHGDPVYARVLALNEKGRSILNKARNISKIPIITKPADHGFPEGSPLFKILQKDVLATDLYVLGYAKDGYSSAGQDFVTSPLFFSEPTRG